MKVFNVGFLVIMILFSAKSVFASGFISANKSKGDSLMVLSGESVKIKDYVRQDAVIAHRGSTYWVPEETEAAFRWARNIGADYLELDLQMTKDSVLIALHDVNLKRTTNIEDVFSERAKSPVSSFTLKELRMLDAGSWFNEKYPDRACRQFKGQKISTLEEVIRIAEGYRLKRDSNGEPVKKLEQNGNWEGHYEFEKDPDDNKNRPGIYIETKNPHLFPGIEKVLAGQLAEHGWLITNQPRSIKTYKNKVGIANTEGRVVLQTFSKESALKLEEHLKGIPKCYLISIRSLNNDTSRLSVVKCINFAVEHNLQIIGPYIGKSFDANDNLTMPWMCELYHAAGLLIHPYSFDTNDQLKKYKDIDGGFTNRSDLSLKYQNRKRIKSAEFILKSLGYK